MRHPLRKKLSAAFFAVAAPLSIQSHQQKTEPPQIIVTAAAASESTTSVSTLVQKSGGVLTPAQAHRRIINARERDGYGLSNYLTLRKDMSSQYEDCFQEDYTASQVPAESKRLWEKTHNLKTSKSGIVRTLTTHSQNANIFLCSQKLPESFGAMWKYNGLGIAWFNTTISETGIAGAYLHEIFHSLQEDRRKRTGNPLNGNLTIYENQMETMANEAAAKIVEVLAMFERHLLDSSPEADAEWKTYHPVYRVTVENAYAQNRKYGLSHIDALEEAGAALWAAVLGNQAWLDIYNTLTVRNFIDFYQKDVLLPSGPEKLDITQIRDSGYVNKKLNVLTRVDHVPSFEKRIGSNTDMIAIFKYLELERIAVTESRQAPAYIDMLGRLEAEGNPFLGVNLELIDLKNDAVMNPVEQMECYAGITKCSGNGRPFNPQKYKRDMRPARYGS